MAKEVINEWLLRRRQRQWCIAVLWKARIITPLRIFSRFLKSVEHQVVRRCIHTQLKRQFGEIAVEVCRCGSFGGIKLLHRQFKFHAILAPGINEFSCAPETYA